MSIPRLKESIKHSRISKSLRSWAASTTLPGFSGISILEIFRFLLQELKKENVFIRANAMAFSFFLSLFPALLFLFSILPYLPIKHLVSTLENSFYQIMPEQTANYLNDIIYQITHVQRDELVYVTLILAFFFSSNGILTMLTGFDKSYQITYKKSSWLRRQTTALFLTVILGGLLILSMFIIVLGRVLIEKLTSWADIDAFSVSLFLILRWIVMILLVYAGISLVYRYGPAMHKRVHFFSPGASFATFASILSSVLFSYYVNNFDTYNKIYGSIGALIAMMLWFQFNSLIILLGYELNASIAVTRDMKSDNN